MTILGLTTFHEMFVQVVHHDTGKVLITTPKETTEAYAWIVLQAFDFKLRVYKYAGCDFDADIELYVHCFEPLTVEEAHAKGLRA